MFGLGGRLLGGGFGSSFRGFSVFRFEVSFRKLYLDGRIFLYLILRNEID